MFPCSPARLRETTPTGISRVADAALKAGRLAQGDSRRGQRRNEGGE
jgi:hypothetical protein